MKVIETNMLRLPIMYDYVDCEYKQVGELALMDDTELARFLPNEPARALYGLYRMKGMSILDAMAKVLEMCLKPHQP